MSNPNGDEVIAVIDEPIRIVKSEVIGNDLVIVSSSAVGGNIGGVTVRVLPCGYIAAGERR